MIAYVMARSTERFYF